MTTIMPTPQPPCGCCTDRFIGCHSKCEKYATWQAEWEKMKSGIRAAAKVESDFCEFNSQSMRKQERKKGKK